MWFASPLFTTRSMRAMYAILLAKFDAGPPKATMDDSSIKGDSNLYKMDQAA